VTEGELLPGIEKMLHEWFNLSVSTAFKRLNNSGYQKHSALKDNIINL